MSKAKKNSLATRKAASEPVSAPATDATPKAASEPVSAPVADEGMVTPVANQVVAGMSARDRLKRNRMQHDEATEAVVQPAKSAKPTSKNSVLCQNILLKENGVLYATLQVFMWLINVVPV
jgi:hypothetical protein